MANISRNSFRDKTTGNLESLREGRFIFKAINNKNQVKSIFLEDYTPAVAGGATVTNDTAFQPEVINEDNVYRPGITNIPVGTQQRIAKKLTFTTATTDTVTYDVSTLDWSNEEYFAFAITSSAASTTVDVIFRSTATNEESFTITVPTTGDNQVVVQKGTGTITGTPNYSALTEIEFIATGANNVSITEIMASNNVHNLPGADLSVGFDCITDQNFNMSKETADQLCYQFVGDVVPTSKNGEFTLSTRLSNLFKSSIFGGNAIERKQFRQRRTLNGPNENSALAVVAGVINLPNLVASEIQKVTIDGYDLQRVYDVNLVDSSSYHYNDSSNDLTVDTIYNGEVPEVTAMKLETVDGITDKNLTRGHYGYGNFYVIDNTGREVQYNMLKVLAVDVAEARDEVGVTYTFNMRILPRKVGKDFLFVEKTEK